MKQAISWLPATTLQDPAASQPFAAAVVSWAENWIAQASDEWSADRSFKSDAPTDWSILRGEACFQILGKPKALIELALAVLGQTSRSDFTEVDLRFLRRLGGRALDDLCMAIEELVPSGSRPVDDGQHPQWHLMIGTGQQSWLAISIQQSALVDIVRARYPKTQLQAHMVSSRDALNDIQVPLAGRVGTAQLAIGQIDTLEVGDLLLLAQPASAPLRLIIASEPSPLYFAIDASGDRLSLVMQENHAEER